MKSVKKIVAELEKLESDLIAVGRSKYAKQTRQQINSIQKREERRKVAKV